MSKDLTARQRLVLDKIEEYCALNGYPPSIRELGKLLDISSLRGVTIHLDALERKGWIKRESTSRSIHVLQHGSSQSGSNIACIPVLGTIAAGIPLLAVENVESYIPLPPDISHETQDIFALRVKGDSMIGDHIIDGDLIIIRSQPSASNGEIIAALIGDEATVKRLDMVSTPPRLLASNPNYQPIEIEREDARILGKVVGLIRLNAFTRSS